jgi:hypothetical protein
VIVLDELIVIASIGTSRKAPTFPPMSPAIDDALSSLAAESAEEKLLGAVAILSRYESCGRIPTPASVALDPAAEESLPACSRRASDLLGQILSMANNDTKSRLIDEWLELAIRAKRRAPHRLLPGLLDYGAFRKASRRNIAEAAGARGAWLMRLNPRWQFEVDGSEDPTSIWTTGTRDQRVAALRRLRETDPAAGRELIRSTWKEDAAEDRSMFVAAMITSIANEDEAFLETCLDDRSKQVRAAAADLLARLPQSAYVRRMIDRADPLMNFTAAKKSGLLRKGAPATVEIQLPPDDFAPDWARDGVVEKPDGRIGRRQWWLQQFLAAIPLMHWSTQWNATPNECIAAVTGEFADVVLTAWHQAALRHPEPKWLAALLLAAREGRGPMTLELLNHLLQDARQAIATEVLESPRISIDVVNQLLRSVDFPLDRHATSALFVQIERYMEQQTAGYAYIAAAILGVAAVRILPGLYDELGNRCTGPKWEPSRKALDEFFQILLIRRDLHREFNA